MSYQPKNQQVCSVCESEPQDMLILTCRHNLCLDCATQVYNIGSKQDKLVCEICLSETNLDDDTIVCLRSLSAKSIQANNNNSPASINYSEHQGIQNRSLRPPHPKNTINHTPYNQLPLIIQQYQPTSSLPLCQKHSQPLTYFCLQCNFFRICSQCMLLQNHRYHKVITLKKATYHIKQSIQKVGREKMKLKNLLEKDRQSLSFRRQQSQKQLQSNLNQLKLSFQSVSRVIAQKYNSLKTVMQCSAKRKLQIMQGAMNQISQKISLIQQTVQFQQQLVSSAVNNNDTHKGPADQNSIFQMFQYYESQMSQNKLNFQPSLPNFIAEVTEESLSNKQRVFEELQLLLQKFTVSPIPQCDDQEESNSTSYDNDENINYMSQIGNENLRINQNSIQRNKTNEFTHYKKHPQQQQYQQPNFNNQRYAKTKSHISQNINIIQINNRLPYAGNPLRKQPKQAKEPKKQSIQTIKRRARENLKDRELSNSRKMQLSRSIVNATDILNKIHQRSTRV